MTTVTHEAGNQKRYKDNTSYKRNIKSVAMQSQTNDHQSRPQGCGNGQFDDICNADDHDRTNNQGHSTLPPPQQVEPEEIQSDVALKTIVKRSSAKKKSALGEKVIVNTGKHGYHLAVAVLHAASIVDEVTGKTSILVEWDSTRARQYVPLGDVDWITRTTPKGDAVADDVSSSRVKRQRSCRESTSEVATKSGPRKRRSWRRTTRHSISSTEASLKSSVDSKPLEHARKDDTHEPRVRTSDAPDNDQLDTKPVSLAMANDPARRTDDDVVTGSMTSAGEVEPIYRIPKRLKGSTTPGQSTDSTADDRAVVVLEAETSPTRSAIPCLVPAGIGSLAPASLTGIIGKNSANVDPITAERTMLQQYGNKQRFQERQCVPDELKKGLTDLTTEDGRQQHHSIRNSANMSLGQKSVSIFQGESATESLQAIDVSTRDIIQNSKVASETKFVGEPSDIPEGRLIGNTKPNADGTPSDSGTGKGIEGGSTVNHELLVVKGAVAGSPKRPRGRPRKYSVVRVDGVVRRQGMPPSRETGPKKPFEEKVCQSETDNAQNITPSVDVLNSNPCMEGEVAHEADATGYPSRQCDQNDMEQANLPNVSKSGIDFHKEEECQPDQLGRLVSASSIDLPTTSTVERKFQENESNQSRAISERVDSNVTLCAISRLSDEINSTDDLVSSTKALDSLWNMDKPSSSSDSTLLKDNNIPDNRLGPLTRDSTTIDNVAASMVDIGAPLPGTREADDSIDAATRKYDVGSNFSLDKGDVLTPDEGKAACLEKNGADGLFVLNSGGTGQWDVVTHAKIKYIDEATPPDDVDISMEPESGGLIDCITAAAHQLVDLADGVNVRSSQSDRLNPVDVHKQAHILDRSSFPETRKSYIGNKIISTNANSEISQEKEDISLIDEDVLTVSGTERLHPNARWRKRTLAVALSSMGFTVASGKNNLPLNYESEIPKGISIPSRGDLRYFYCGFSMFHHRLSKMHKPLLQYGCVAMKSDRTKENIYDVIYLSHEELLDGLDRSVYLKVNDSDLPAEYVSCRRFI